MKFTTINERLILAVAFNLKGFSVTNGAATVYPSREDIDQ
jgi:hypothetical protein